MHPPEERAAPDIVAGRRVRAVRLELADGLAITALEAADTEAVLDASVTDGADPYAAILWPSAIAVAARLPQLVGPGDTVLDIGAGTGVAALAAARLGARAIALDHDPFARAVVAAAAELQDLVVDVRDFDLRGEERLPRADLAVMADVLYEPQLARAAAARALEASAAGIRVLIGDPARYGRSEFQRAMSAAGIAVDFEDVLVRVPGEPHPARVGVALLP